MFSIIVPVYNRAKTIGDTLETVIRQEFQDFECLIIDDGSVDGDSLQHVIKSLNDPRFVLIRQDNAGGGAARNRGILSARRNWLAFLDSDDGFLPEKLLTVSKHIKSSPSVDVWSHLALVDRGNSNKMIRPTRLPNPNESVLDMMFRHREFMQTSTLVVRADIAKRVLFDPTLRKAQDVDFMVRLERAGANLRCLPEVLSVWNDKPAENRVGSPRRPADVLRWYNAQRPHFSRDIRWAFEATYLAYEIAPQAPLRAAYAIVRASICGVIAWKLGLACLLRAFLSQPVYRRLIDRFVVRSRAV